MVLGNTILRGAVAFAAAASMTLAGAATIAQAQEASFFGSIFGGDAQQEAPEEEQAPKLSLFGGATQTDPADEEVAEVVEVADPAESAPGSELTGMGMVSELPFTLFDNESCSMVVTNYGDIDRWGDPAFAVNVDLTNKTADQTFRFRIDEAAVCGWMVDPYWSEEVEPGATVSSTFTWNSEELAEYGIDEVTLIQLAMRVYDTESYDDIVDGAFVLAPQGLDAAYTTSPSIPDDAVVLAEGEGYQAIVLGSSLDSWGDYEVVLYYNNDSDMALNFSTDYESIEGWEVWTYGGATVLPYSQAARTMSFDADDLEALGVEQPTDVEFELRIGEYDDYSNVLFEDYVAYYPLGEAAATQAVRAPQPTDLPIYSDEYASVTGLSVVPSNDWGEFCIDVLLENYTDASVMFSIDDVYLNGVECDPYWASSVAPGKKKISTISWNSSALESAGLTPDSISSISFRARIYNNDDWSVPNYVDQTFELTF